MDRRLGIVEELGSERRALVLERDALDERRSDVARRLADVDERILALLDGGKEVSAPLPKAAPARRRRRARVAGPAGEGT